MRKTFVPLLFSIACLILAPSKGFAKTHPEGVFRSIIIADTKDVNIGYSCASDAHRLEKSLQAIGSQLHMKAAITVLDKNKCCCADLGKWLSELHSSPTDIIMVFYAGHGRGDRAESTLPLLLLRDGEIRGAALQSVIEQLPCRLSLVLFDCCNPFPEEGGSIIRNRFHPIIHKGRKLGQLKPLFQSRSAITVCAANRGENAWGGHTGGYLTTGFLRAMKTPPKKTAVSWGRILAKAKWYSAKRSHNQQHSFYTIKAR